MTEQSPKYFYTTDSWDERAWLDVVAVEYGSLVAAYPFDQNLRGLSVEGQLNVLDVGCGSAIFPQYLDPVLSDEMHLTCDLLDVSERSLEQSGKVMETLEHFSARLRIQTLIEDIPDTLPKTEPAYAVIWAIHSLTTVDLDLMPTVFRHLLELLAPTGQMLIYQLAHASTYQILHQAYRKQTTGTVTRFMESEDTERILGDLPVDYQVLEMQFDHVLPGNRPELLENYLRKCVLDESVDTEKVFGDLLHRFHSGGQYHFPQFVNFISVSKR